MRIGAHQIDTQARKMVPMALPREWEFREKTGRDYGIDLEAEVFEDQKSTGQILMFQIKGTEKTIKFKQDVSAFDVPTNTLIYSERFVTPIILAVCPINNEKHVFYYVWLQDYIKSVLNFDNQNWRKNKSTTRIFIPENNLMPDKKEHLAFISHFPQRLYGACGVARILHNLQYTLDGDPRPCDYEYVDEQLQVILNLPGFLTGQWIYGEFIRVTYLQPALLAAQLLYRQKEPTQDELKLLPSCSKVITNNRPEWMTKEENIEFQLKCQVSHGLNCMSFFFEETNYGFKNTLWKAEKLHNF